MSTIIEARVKNLIQTEQEWLMSNPVILKGEVAYVIFGNLVNTKVGDGIKKFSELNYNLQIPAAFKGTALRDLDPGVTDAPEFYFAGESGIYPKFSNLQVNLNNGLTILVGSAGTWKATVIPMVSASYVQKTDLASLVKTSVLEVGDNRIAPDSDPQYILSQQDAQGYIAWGITRAVNAKGQRILKGIALPSDIEMEAKSLKAESIQAKETISEKFKTPSQVISEDPASQFIFSQQDAAGNIAWGITRQVDANGNYILKGAAPERISTKPPEALTILPGHTIYTTCDDISAWNDKPRAFSLNVYVERFAAMTVKNVLSFESTKALYKTLASRRYFHPEPQGGAPTMQNNFMAVTHTQEITEGITGAAKNTTITFNHVSTLASAGANKTLRVLKIGDSNVNAGESDKNRPYTNSPKQSWAWHKYYLELDKDDNGGNGYKSVFIGTKSLSNFDIIKTTTRNVKVGAEGYSGWNTRDLLYTKTFADGNRFYNPEAPGTVKFSLNKYLARYRTMSDDGVRLAENSPQKGTEVASTSDYDVCTPNVIIIQMGFNDSAANYVADMKLMIQSIKAEFPQMVIGIAFVGAAGTYYPELWPGWQAAAKDISFLEPMNIINGYGYSKRLNDKMNGLYTAAKELEDKANRVYFLPHNLIQPTANGVPNRDQSEPYGLKCYQPVGESSFAYHPNNGTHAVWGYHEYSWTRHICAQELI